VKHQRSFFHAWVGLIRIPEKACRDTLRQTYVLHQVGSAGHIVHSVASGMPNVTSDTSTLTHNQVSDPITPARAHQLNNQVSSFLASYSSYLDNGNMCSILLLRNGGQD
jgi:hypothetical protein